MFSKLRFDQGPSALRRWETLWEQTEGATTFQHPSYFSVVEQHTKCRLQLIWNKEETACLPICLTPLKLGVWRRDLAHQGKYGGALGSFDESLDWWRSCLQYIDGGLLNPWQTHPAVPTDINFSQSETTVFSFSEDNQSRKFRSLLRKAQDAHLEVKKIPFVEVASNFEKVHAEQCNRWKVPYIGKDLRRAQFSLSGSETFAVFEKNGRPIHIEVYMKSGGVLINCLVAQSSDGRKSGAGVALLNAHMTSFSDQDNFLDLGPSGGFDHVKHYKTTIGGQNLGLKQIQNDRLLVRGRFAIGKAKVDLFDAFRKPR